MFGLEWKSRGMKKMSLYKFTHVPLFKNDAQLKQKVTNKPKKKNKINHLNLLKNKNHVKKKHVYLKKKKKSLSPHALENQKKK